MVKDFVMSNKNTMLHFFRAMVLWNWVTILVYSFLSWKQEYEIGKMNLLYYYYTEEKSIT